MHADLGTLVSERVRCVLSCTWHFILALLDHTWANFGTNAPASCLEFNCRVVGVVLTGRCLESLSLVECEVSAGLSSDLVSWFTLLGSSLLWGVVARTWLEGLLLAVRRVGRCGTHRVAGHVFASILLGHVVTGSRYIHLGLLIVAG